jgi:DNA repair exonuclease SbcCD nuclease subunit
MSKPFAVLISDIHFNVNALLWASSSLRQALNRATNLGTPLIIAGDLNDTKAIIRGEVANVIIEILSRASIKVFILVGNHDLLSEKTKESGLDYLKPYATVINKVTKLTDNVTLLPYYNDSAEISNILSAEPAGNTVIMHQGFRGAMMGDYIQDKTSVDPKLASHLRVFSGHYHRHQTIGTITYIGSPYTITFGEANDGPKGFLVLNEDGTYEQIPTNLRKHVIIEGAGDDEGFSVDWDKVHSIGDSDLIWVKLRGSQSNLAKIDKIQLGNLLFNHSNYKLDLIPTDSTVNDATPIDKTNEEIFDSIIDSLSDSKEHKDYLKTLYRSIICNS